MAFELDNLQLTLEQSQEQRLLRVVRVGYAYLLKNNGEPGVKDSAAPFVTQIDILGDDILTDDLLAEGVDRHELHCEAGAECQVTRGFMVAQGVLDEDIGDDEIKLRIRVSRGNESPVTALTPIVKGKF